MRFRDSQLHGVPVYTQQGRQVGKLTGYIIDADTHEVIQYVVKKSVTLEALLPKEFLVNRTQVISISLERIVVEDAAVTNEAIEQSRGKVPKANPAGLHSSAD